MQQVIQVLKHLKKYQVKELAYVLHTPELKSIIQFKNIIVKKLLFIISFLIAIAGLHTSAFAQSSASTSKSSLNATDTAYAYIPVSGLYAVVGIQPEYTKTSGTVAGNVIIDKTIDGVGWIALDTLALSNASPNIFGLNPNSKVFTYPQPAATQYRVRFITSTGVGTVKVYYMLRK